MRKAHFGVGILALLLASAFAYSRTSEGALDGVVLSGKGAPVAFAEVLWQTADGKAPHALRANASGHFRIAVRQGLYELRAEALGMTSEWEHNVLVRAGRVSTLTLRLSRPKSPSGSTKKS
jgi:carboxypeptidase family protein